MNIGWVLLLALKITMYSPLAETPIPFGDPAQTIDTDFEIEDEDNNVNIAETKRHSQNLDPTGSVDDLKDQMQFFNNFACLLLVKEYLALHEKDYAEISDENKASKILQKSISIFFKTCKHHMTPDVEMVLMTGKAPKDFQMINLDELSEYRVPELPTSLDLQLTEEDMQYIKAYEQVEREVKNMQEDFEENEDKYERAEVDEHNEHDVPEHEPFEEEDDKLKFRLWNLSDIEGLLTIAAMLIVLGVLLYNIWISICTKKSEKAEKHQSSLKVKKKKSKK